MDNFEFAHKLLEVAKPILQENYLNLVKSAKLASLEESSLLEWKQANKKDVVTVGEKQAEAAMIKLVKEYFPEHNIIGEEYGVDANNADFSWVFDPIDGTAAMLESAIASAHNIDIEPSKQPYFGITIALVHKGKPVLSVVHDLVNDITWSNNSEGEILVNGNALKSQMVQHEMKDAVLASTVPDIMFKSQSQIVAFNSIINQVKQLVINRNCIGFMQLLNQEVDVVWEGDLAYHDVVALVPILEKAGIKITDEAGQELDFSLENVNKEYRVVTALPELHEKIISNINENRSTQSLSGAILLKTDSNNQFYAEKFK